MPKYNTVTHVIFDLDGLMLDTEVIYTNVYTELVHQYKAEYPWELRMKHMGTNDQDSAKIIIEELKLPTTIDKFVVEQQNRVKSLLKTCSLLPGVDRLVRHLHKNKIPIAVATSSTKESFEQKITNHKEVFTLFNHIVTGGSDPELKRGKPAPDIYLLCASRFPGKPPPNKVLVLEDAPNGVQGSRAAGMQVVMVPDPHVAEEKRQGATLVLQSLETFKPEEFGLPAF